MVNEFEKILMGLKTAKKGQGKVVAGRWGKSESYLTQVLNKHRNIKLKDACIIARAAGTSLGEILNHGHRGDSPEMDKELLRRYFKLQDELDKLRKENEELRGKLKAVQLESPPQFVPQTKDVG